MRRGEDSVGRVLVACTSKRTEEGQKLRSLLGQGCEKSHQWGRPGGAAAGRDRLRVSPLGTEFFAM